MGHFQSKYYQEGAPQLSIDKVIQLFDDEDEEMLNTCSEVLPCHAICRSRAVCIEIPSFLPQVDEATLRQIMETNLSHAREASIGTMHTAASVSSSISLLGVVPAVLSAS